MTFFSSLLIPACRHPTQISSGPLQFPIFKTRSEALSDLLYHQVNNPKTDIFTFHVLIRTARYPSSPQGLHLYPSLHLRHPSQSTHNTLLCSPHPDSKSGSQFFKHPHHIQWYSQGPSYRLYRNLAREISTISCSIPSSRRNARRES
jgi:hypothetical protein